MRPSGRFQCTGCRVEFASLGEWRDGELVPDGKRDGISYLPGARLAPSNAFA